MTEYLPTNKMSKSVVLGSIGLGLSPPPENHLLLAYTT